MMTRVKNRRGILIVALLLVGPIVMLTLAGPGDGTKTDPGNEAAYLDKSGDEELVRLIGAWIPPRYYGARSAVRKNALT